MPFILNLGEEGKSKGREEMKIELGNFFLYQEIVDRMQVRITIKQILTSGGKRIKMAFIYTVHDNIACKPCYCYCYFSLFTRK